MQPDRAHNDYLNLLADWGTAGGLITLAGMAVFAAGLWQTRRHVRRVEKEFKSGHSNRLAFFLGASAGLLALAVHSVVDFNLHIPANAILGVTLLALLSSNLRFATEKFWFNIRLPVKIVRDARARRRNFLSGRAGNPPRPRNLLARPRGTAAVIFRPNAPPPWKRPLPPTRKIFRPPTPSANVIACKVSTARTDYESLAKTAMDWFSRGMKLNPYDGYNYMGYGMCLDWLERHDEAGNLFQPRRRARPQQLFCRREHRLALRPGRRLRRRAPVAAAVV